MDLAVRDARPEDAEAILAVLNPIIEAGTYTALDKPLTADEERQYILSFPRRGIFHVAIRQADQRLVGFQSMEPFATFTGAFDHVGVLGTYVELSLLRRGIAHRLFEATFDAGRKKGYEKIFTYVRADNPGALATYRRQGFRVVGTAEKQAKIRGRYVDEVIIERFL